jgi:hypothetical protein
MDAFAKLVRLSAEIVSGQSGSSSLWQGADVVITSKSPIVQEGGFYPSPRYVVTSHAGELSWLFEQIRNIFMEIEDYGVLKEEIFGRLGNTVNRFLSKNPGANIHETLLAVMHEAFAIAEEIRDGEFATLLVTTGNQILDDLISESEKTGFLSVEATQKYFKDKGIIE